MLNNLGHLPEACVMIRAEVAGLQEAINSVVANGGEGVVPPIPLPNGRSFAWVKDPVGIPPPTYTVPANLTSGGRVSEPSKRRGQGLVGKRALNGGLWRRYNSPKGEIYSLRVSCTGRWPGMV